MKPYVRTGQCSVLFAAVANRLLWVLACIFQAVPALATTYTNVFFNASQTMTVVSSSRNADNVPTSAW